MRILQQLLSNYILMAAILSWMLSQVIKTILTLVITKKFVPERIFGAGGMPSAHSAMVSSLAISIARVSGPSTPEFALAVAFAAVVMYDAMGVRRAAGEQAKVINKMVDIWEEKGSDVSDKELKEYLGHTPMEVLAGAMVGILVGVAIG
jgi:acid phosphatase family membrane protein YuiD